MAKYHNKKVVIDGITFDSKKEANRYNELKAMEKAGLIKSLALQVKYELIPQQYEMVERYSDKTGKRLKDRKHVLEAPCSYVADFTYIDEHGELVVEDTKGFRTPEYKIKRKLMLWVHGIQIKEL